jgi:hypothetical protein
MTAPVPAMPQRPADVADDATLAVLLDHYARLVLALASARAAGHPADPDHALAALATGAAVAADLAAERPGIVRDALRSGATPAQVTAATGHAPAPPPLEREPRSVRPPFADRDGRFDSLQLTDPEGWRRAVHLDRMAALLEPLAGLDLSEREHAAVGWLAGWDIPTIAPIVRLLHAARAAEPLPAGSAR